MLLVTVDTAHRGYHFRNPIYWTNIL